MSRTFRYDKRSADRPPTSRLVVPATPASPRSQVVQTKLLVGPSDDRHEREADQIADRIVRRLARPDAAARPAQTPTTRPQGIGRAVAARGPGSVVGAEGGALDQQTAAEINRARGTGQPLHPGVRQSMEHGFGTDFSSVRVHTGGHADDLSQRLQARAFTIGSDIFFRSGDYRPDTGSGQKLLAHELTHVVQQGGSVHRAVIRREIVFNTDEQWRRKVQFGRNDVMLYKTASYPHVTVDVKEKATTEEGMNVEFTSMHYSRSKDDPYRCGYADSSGGWMPESLDGNSTRQKQCDDAVDEFLSTVGARKRVKRGQSLARSDNGRW